jgi:ribose transport system permease protein
MNRNKIIFTRIKSLFNPRNIFLPYFLVVVLLVIGEIISKGFARPSHIMTMLHASAFLGLVSLGETVVIVSGKEGIDLSVGAIFTVGVVLAAAVLNGQDSRLIFAFVVIPSAGFILGAINGLGVAFLRIAPLIMTMAWGIAIEGIAYFSTSGYLPGGPSPLLRKIGSESLRFGESGNSFGIPFAVFIWLIVIVIAELLLRKTRMGYVLYALGTNEKAAKLSGIKVRFIRVCAYGFSGLSAALAGMLMLGYVGDPNLGLGNRYILPAVVASIIGGVSLKGGLGRYVGAVAGAIFLTSLLSILTTMGFGLSGRQLIVGVVLLVLLGAYKRA